MSLSATAPRLSVVVATDCLATIDRLVDHLVAQTVAAEIELVLVCPSAGVLGLPEERLETLGAVRVVEHPLLPLGEARAAGIRASTAPVVVVGETHAFPAPEWAVALVRAHEEWDVVMPSVANANPDGAASWSAYLVDYGRWAPWTAEAVEIEDPPPYHASFKKDALLAFGGGLGQLVEPGSTLARELRERGQRAYLEPRARIDHLNLTQPRAWVHERFLGGRLLGAARRARWSPGRTLVYLAGSPLIPIVWLARARPAVRAAGQAGLLRRRTRSAIVLACVVWAVGEVVGYVAGAGRSGAMMLEYELHKERYVARSGGKPTAAA